MLNKITEKLLKSLVPAEKSFELVDPTLPGFVVLVASNGLISFKLRYRFNGRKTSITIGRYGPITLAQAKDEARKHWATLASGVDPQAAKKEREKQARHERSALLGAFIHDHYTPWVELNRKSSAKTLKILNRTFAHWHKTPMSELSKALVQKWQLSELRRGLKPATITRNLNALRGVLSHAIDIGALKVHPFKGLKNLQEPEELRTRYLTQDETVRLLTALQERNQEFLDKRRSANNWRRARGKETLREFSSGEYGDHVMPFVLVAMHTGMRFGEICLLDWSDVDFTQANVTVRAKTAKANRQRHIKLNKVAIDVLKTWSAQTGGQSGLVFPNPKGKRLSSIKTAWAGLMRRSGIKDLHVHDLRHNFASQLAMKNAPLIMLRDLMGHANIQTTMRYTHLADDLKAEVVALLE